MLKKIYIGNLPFHTTEKQVRELFAPYGDIFVVDMVTDHETDQFRGFGFVEMEADAADAAIAGLKGQKYEGRNVKISEARSDKAAPGNHPGSNMHLRTSRSLYGGKEEFGHNGREAGNVRGSMHANSARKQGGNKAPKGKPKAAPKGKGKGKPKAKPNVKGRKKRGQTG